jgi:hypothetical protein
LKTVGIGISATSTTQSSSPQHPMRKIGNRRHVPSLLIPHSPLRLDLLKDKSLPWLSFFLLKAPSPKLIHNAFQSVGLSVLAAVVYVITFVGCWQPCVMFKQVLCTVVVTTSIRGLQRIQISLLIRSPRSVPPHFQCIIPYHDRCKY